MIKATKPLFIDRVTITILDETMLKHTALLINLIKERFTLFENALVCKSFSADELVSVDLAFNSASGGLLNQVIQFNNGGPNKALI